MADRYEPYVFDANGNAWAPMNFAQNAHTHSASDIVDGTLDAARLPLVPITSGGTGATTAAAALTNLGAAAASHTHSQYVAKAGDTMTGTLILKNAYCHTASPGGGTAGYMKLVTFTITQSYVNSPILLTIAQRGNPSTNLEIIFANAGNSDPDLQTFVFDGARSQFWLHKSATSTWDLWAQKEENYGEATITSFCNPAHNVNGITVTWKSDFIATLPSGAIQCNARTINHNHSAANITSGTLGVARGGTGATTFTSGAALIGNGTGAVGTRAIYTRGSLGTLDWGTNNDALLTKAAIAYWNGAYTGTSSNIAYLGTIKGGVWNGSAIPVAYGGTGATTPAAARTNLSTPAMTTETFPALLPINGNNNWIKIGTTNNSYGLLPSQSGNAGNGHNYLGTSNWYWGYCYCDYYYGTWNGNAVTVARGGTGATGAGGARTNLGLNYVSLYSGTFKSGSATFTNGALYQVLIFVIQPSTGTSYVQGLVPTSLLTTSDQAFQFADNDDWVTVSLKKSGNNVIMTFKTVSGNGGSVKWVGGKN